MNSYDVLIVGGGSAGLAAAVVLARSLRSVLVVDAGSPRNAPADGAHNVLGHEGVSPLDLLATGRTEAQSYGAQIRSVDAVAVRALDESGGGDRFELDLSDGTTVRGRRLLLTTGLTDVLPDLPGVREGWGHDVLHCPYCHGWEVRGRRIGVIGTGPMAGHVTLLLRNLSDRVTLFAHAMPPLDPQDRARLDALGVEVVDGPVRELARAEGSVRAVVLADGREFPVEAVAVAPRLVANADLYTALGGTLAENPMGVYIPADPIGRTEIDGVWAAGNVADLSSMVVASAAAGVMAGAQINAELVRVDADLAVERTVPAAG